MDFLGVDGWCAPRLKDASLSFDELITCYHTIVLDMRRMYQDCNLVHGDLSEYNLLWYRHRPVIIGRNDDDDDNNDYSSDKYK